jgi:hypothetical protein
MERPSKFDKTVQQRMAQLQDEPSARVWSGIRSEIGYTRRKTSPVWFRIAAGAALVAGLGAAWYFLAPAGPAEQRYDATALHHSPRRWEQPKVIESLSGNPLLVDTTPDAMPQPYIGKRMPSMPTPGPQPSPTPQAPITPRPDERFVEKELSPQQEMQEQRMVPTVPVQVQEAEAIAGRKRSFRLPKAEELTLENLKTQSASLLPNLAQTASERLGIDTQYERKASDNATTTKFSVDLGLVKFKKVRQTKS